MKTTTKTAYSLLAAVMMTAAACVPMPPTPASGQSPNSAPRAGEAAYAEHGPFEVGVTTLQMSDRKVEVWYPVDPEDIGNAPRDAYFIRDYVSTAFDQLLPAEVDPPFVTDATRDVPASGAGPFPLVLFSHGFASYRTQSTALTTHLASWGFMVISPDYLERGLRSVLGEPPASPRSDTGVADEAITLLRSQNLAAGGPLEGRVDSSSVYPTGHSAGGGTSLRLLERADVHSVIPMAAGYNLLSQLNGSLTLPEGKSIAWIGGVKDGIAAIADIRRGFDYTPGERKLIEISGAGHNNAFTDICEIGEGGVAALALSTGIPIPSSLLALGDNGCKVPPFRDSPDVWPEVRHFLTAELRYRSGLDAQPVGLGDQVLTSFDDIARYRHNP
jgi:dienelactone hydrolase